jgi:hypothetical protein
MLDDGTLWLAMKLIHGQTLAELLGVRSSSASMPLGSDRIGTTGR